MNVKNVMTGLRVLYPSPNLAKPRLVTISLSHYAEKSRWAMDLSPMKLQYYEEMHCPALHLTTTMVELSRFPRVQTWDKDSEFQRGADGRHPPKIARSKDLTGVPKLVLPKWLLEQHHIRLSDNAIAGVVAGGSAGIIKFLADIFPSEMGHLYPSGPLGSQVLDTEKLLDVELGPAATAWSFANMILTGPKFYIDPAAEGINVASDTNANSIQFLLSNIIKADVPTIEKVCFRLFGSKAIPLMIKHNGVSAKSRLEARDRIEAVFQTMDALLAKNNPNGSVLDKFLLGSDQITAADIALAALSMPILMPRRQQPFFATRDLFEAMQAVDNAPGCVDMLNFSNELMEKHRSARYAMDLYEKCRPTIDVRCK